VKVIPLWMVIVIGAPLLLALLAALRNRETGRSALYSCAVGVERGLCLFAAVFPTIARVIEGLPDSFRAAWFSEKPSEKEREKFEVYRARSA